MATILLVEDHDTNIEVATVICSAAGHRVVVARTGAEALELVEQEPVDFILMDVLMPTMDGITATKLLRQRETLARVPIVGLTALVDAETRNLAFAAGMDGLLYKPYRNKQLLAALDEGWSRRAAVKTVAHRPTNVTFHISA